MSSVTYFCEDEALAFTLEQLIISTGHQPTLKTSYVHAVHIFLPSTPSQAIEYTNAHSSGSLLLVTSDVTANLPASHNHTVLNLPLKANVLVEHIQRTCDAENNAVESTTLFGDWALNAASLHHASTNETIKLTEKEAQLLLYLLEKTGAVVERETLLQHVWKYESDTQTNTLETHMYRLRGKLAALNLSVECGILTKEDGYMWLPPQNMTG